MKSVKITARDSYARINGDKTEHVFEHGIDIIADDGNALFEIGLGEDGALEIRCSSCVKHNEVILTEQVLIQPYTSNAIFIVRHPYKKPQKT